MIDEDLNALRFALLQMPGSNAIRIGYYLCSVAELYDVVMDAIASRVGRAPAMAGAHKNGV